MLQWAHANGCPCPELNILLGIAAMSGNVEMMTWFREQGCQLRGRLCARAAEYGRLVLLRWLREQGGPADLDVCTYRATHGGHDEVVGGWVSLPSKRGTQPPTRLRMSPTLIIDGRRPT